MAVVDKVRSEIDLYSDEVLNDPYDAYRELRDAGPVVYMEKIDAYAVARFDGAREVLRDWERFCSGQGVTLNAAANEAFEGTVLGADPPAHTKLRQVLRDELAPGAINKLNDDIAGRADELVAELVERGEFDAHTDLAAFLPISIVADLIGIPKEGRESLLDWSKAIFNIFGPEDNERTASALPIAGEFYEYLAVQATREKLTPGSMGMAVYEAADRGEIDQESCLPLLSAYVSAGMDTTISAIGSGMLLLASHPDQWELLRADPSLIRSAVNEILRYESPVQIFSRLATEDQVIDGSEIAGGKRVLAMFGSANRDERKYENADAFDVTRNPADHLSFGFGIHRCAGAALSLMEMEAVFGSLAKRAQTIELAGEPVRTLNNALRSVNSLPVRVTPRRG